MASNGPLLVLNKELRGGKPRHYNLLQNDCGVVYSTLMPTVQPPQQFLDDFISQAKHARTRIFIQSMIFERGNALSKLEPIILQKAKEGLDVRVTIDWVAGRYVHDDLSVLPPLSPSKRAYKAKVHKENSALIERWTKNGVVFTHTNIPNFLLSPLTILRRNHSKLFIIDDSAAWIGGVNLFDVAMGWIDFMVKFTDTSTIAPLSHQYGKVNHNRPADNYSVQCTPKNKLLIDAGKIGDSLIYAEAIDCIKQAKQTIIFASQFLPDHDLLHELIKASKRGITITVITSNKDYKLFQTLPYKPFYNFSKHELDKFNIEIVHQRTKVHAKLIIVDNKVALFGSHNFVHSGAILGTEEIAMRTEEAGLVKQLKDFINSNTSTS